MPEEPKNRYAPFWEKIISQDFFVADLVEQNRIIQEEPLLENWSPEQKQTLHKGILQAFHEKRNNLPVEWLSAKEESEEGFWGKSVLEYGGADPTDLARRAIKWFQPESPMSKGTAGIIETGANLLEDFTSPTGLAMLTGAGAVGMLLGAGWAAALATGFGIYTLYDLAINLPDVYRAGMKGDIQEASKLLTEKVAMAGMGVAGGAATGKNLPGVGKLVSAAIPALGKAEKPYPGLLRRKKLKEYKEYWSPEKVEERRLAEIARQKEEAIAEASTETVVESMRELFKDPKKRAEYDAIINPEDRAAFVEKELKVKAEPAPKPAPKPAAAPFQNLAKDVTAEIGSMLKEPAKLEPNWMDNLPLKSTRPLEKMDAPSRETAIRQLAIEELKNETWKQRVRESKGLDVEASQNLRWKETQMLARAFGLRAKGKGVTHEVLRKRLAETIKKRLAAKAALEAETTKAIAKGKPAKAPEPLPDLAKAAKAKPAQGKEAAIARSKLVKQWTKLPAATRKNPKGEARKLLTRLQEELTEPELNNLGLQKPKPKKPVTKPATKEAIAAQKMRDTNYMDQQASQELSPTYTRKLIEHHGGKPTGNLKKDRKWLWNKLRVSQKGKTTAARVRLKESGFSDPQAAQELTYEPTKRLARHWGIEILNRKDPKTGRTIGKRRNIQNLRKELNELLTLVQEGKLSEAKWNELIKSGKIMKRLADPTKEKKWGEATWAEISKVLKGVPVKQTQAKPGERGFLRFDPFLDLFRKKEPAKKAAKADPELEAFNREVESVVSGRYDLPDLEAIRYRSIKGGKPVGKEPENWFKDYYRGREGEILTEPLSPEDELVIREAFNASAGTLAAMREGVPLPEGRPVPWEVTTSVDAPTGIMHDRVNLGRGAFKDPETGKWVEYTAPGVTHMGRALTQYSEATARSRPSRKPVGPEPLDPMNIPDALIEQYPYGYPLTEAQRQALLARRTSQDLFPSKRQAGPREAATKKKMGVEATTPPLKATGAKTKEQIQEVLRPKESYPQYRDYIEGKGEFELKPIYATALGTSSKQRLANSMRIVEEVLSRGEAPPPGEYVPIGKARAKKYITEEGDTSVLTAMNLSAPLKEIPAATFPKVLEAYRNTSPLVAKTNQLKARLRKMDPESPAAKKLKKQIFQQELKQITNPNEIIGVFFRKVQAEVFRAEHMPAEGLGRKLRGKGSTAPWTITKLPVTKEARLALNVNIPETRQGLFIVHQNRKTKLGLAKMVLAQFQEQVKSGRVDKEIGFRKIARKTQIDSARVVAKIPEGAYDHRIHPTREAAEAFLMKSENSAHLLYEQSGKAHTFLAADTVPLHDPNTPGWFMSISSDAMKKVQETGIWPETFWATGVRLLTIAQERGMYPEFLNRMSERGVRVAAHFFRVGEPMKMSVAELKALLIEKVRPDTITRHAVPYDYPHGTNQPPRKWRIRAHRIDFPMPADYVPGQRVVRVARSRMRDIATGEREGLPSIGGATLAERLGAKGEAFRKLFGEEAQTRPPRSVIEEPFGENLAAHLSENVRVAKNWPDEVWRPKPGEIENVLEPIAKPEPFKPSASLRRPQKPPLKPPELLPRRVPARKTPLWQQLRDLQARMKYARKRIAQAESKGDKAAAEKWKASLTERRNRVKFIYEELLKQEREIDAKISDSKAKLSKIWQDMASGRRLHTGIPTDIPRNLLDIGAFVLMKNLKINKDLWKAQWLLELGNPEIRAEVLKNPKLIDRVWTHAKRMAKQAEAIDQFGLMGIKIALGKNPSAHVSETGHYAIAAELAKEKPEAAGLYHSIAQKLKAADSPMGKEFEAAWKISLEDLAANRKKAFARPAEAIASRRYVVEAANKLEGIRNWDMTQPGNMIRAIQAITEFEYRAALDAGRRRETAKALNTLRLLKQAEAETPTGEVFRYFKVIENILKKERKEMMRKQHLTRAPRIKPEQVMEHVRNMLFLKTPLERYRYVQNMQDLNWWDVGNWYLFNSYLSSPKTQERNILGNITNVVGHMAANEFASAIDAVKAVSLASGTKYSPSHFRTTTHVKTRVQLKAMRDGMKEGLSKAKLMIRDGYTEESLSLFDIPRKEVRWNKLFKLIMGVEGKERPAVDRGLNLLGRTLEGVDIFFKSAAFEMEKISAAHTKAMRTYGRKYTPEHAAEFVNDSEVIQLAGRYANRVTYKEPSPLVKRMVRLKQTSPGTELAMNVLMPFIRTPYNIVKLGLEFSPVGVIRGAKALSRSKGDPFAQREAMQLMARGIMGSTVLILPAMLAEEGYITGEGPPDPAKRTWLTMNGWKPNSFSLPLHGLGEELKLPPDPNRPGHYWVDYRGFTPLTIPMSMVANLVESFMYSDKVMKFPQDQDDIANMMLSIAQAGFRTAVYTLDQTYLNTLFNFIEALRGAETERGQTFVGRFLADMLRTSLPLSALQRSLASARYEYVPKPAGVYDRIASSAPFSTMRGNVPVKIDLFGRPQKQPKEGKGIGPGLGRMLDLFDVSEEKWEPLVQLMNEAEYSPSWVNSPDVKYRNLSPEEVRVNEILKGRMRYHTWKSQLLDRPDRMEAYAKLDKVGKQEYLGRIGAAYNQVYKLPRTTTFSKGRVQKGASIGEIFNGLLPEVPRDLVDVNEMDQVYEWQKHYDNSVRRELRPILIEGEKLEEIAESLETGHPDEFVNFLLDVDARLQRAFAAAKKLFAENYRGY